MLCFYMLYLDPWKDVSPTLGLVHAWVSLTSSKHMPFSQAIHWIQIKRIKVLKTDPWKSYYLYLFITLLIYHHVGFQRIQCTSPMDPSYLLRWNSNSLGGRSRTAGGSYRVQWRVSKGSWKSMEVWCQTEMYKLGSSQLFFCSDFEIISTSLPWNMFLYNRLKMMWRWYVCIYFFILAKLIGF